MRSEAVENPTRRQRCVLQWQIDVGAMEAAATAENAEAAAAAATWP
ncbi:hypothetical protein K9B32_21150 [Rhizobium sp. 3T7]|nr:hypothetical protein [Rhizobium sp. 3T7]MBZ9792590.1 hypothetical protein [Rhizobium sp. 3T7]